MKDRKLFTHRQCGSHDGLVLGKGSVRHEALGAQHQSTIQTGFFLCRAVIVITHRSFLPPSPFSSHRGVAFAPFPSPPPLSHSATRQDSTIVQAARHGRLRGEAQSGATVVLPECESLPGWQYGNQTGRRGLP